MSSGITKHIEHRHSNRTQKQLSFTINHNSSQVRHPVGRRRPKVASLRNFHNFRSCHAGSSFVVALHRLVSVFDVVITTCWCLLRHLRRQRHGQRSLCESNICCGAGLPQASTQDQLSSDLPRTCDELADWSRQW